jgi:hypothetical protein
VFIDLVKIKLIRLSADRLSNTQVSSTIVSFMEFMIHLKFYKVEQLNLQYAFLNMSIAMKIYKATQKLAYNQSKNNFSILIT